jgi:hypothetical protein
MATGVQHEPTHPSQRRWVVYTTAGLLFAGLLVVMLVIANNHQSNVDQSLAEQRAATLQSRLRDAGLAVPSTTTITQVLGSDGGAVCANPGGNLVDAVSGAVNGAAGPGVRPTVVAQRLIQAGRIVIEVYCPDQSAAFEDYVDSLNLTDSTSDDGT